MGSRFWTRRQDPLRKPQVNSVPPILAAPNHPGPEPKSDIDLGSGLSSFEGSPSAATSSIRHSLQPALARVPIAEPKTCFWRWRGPATMLNKRQEYVCGHTGDAAPQHRARLKVGGHRHVGQPQVVDHELAMPPWLAWLGLLHADELVLVRADADLLGVVDAGLPVGVRVGDV